LSTGTFRVLELSIWKSGAEWRGDTSKSGNRNVASRVILNG